MTAADLALDHHQAEINGFRMHYVRAGTGPVLVLLHGWPQSCYEWNRVIPALAERFTVIAPDLRGLGDSEKPDEGYDKRTLAGDIAALAAHLGYHHIDVLGHDWGGAVGYYLAYDHPDLVRRLMVLDMVPGLARAGEPVPIEVGLRANHIFFHAGDPDWAAALVSKNVDGYLRRFLTALDFNYSPSVFTEEDIAEYVRVNSLPGALRAGFEYYAAGLRKDTHDLVANTEKLRTPVSVWFGDVFLGSLFDPVEVWGDYAHDVRGGIIEQCGHFVAEEQPQRVIDEALKFFDRPNDH